MAFQIVNKLFFFAVKIIFIYISKKIKTHVDHLQDFKTPSNTLHASKGLEVPVSSKAFPASVAAR